VALNVLSKGTHALPFLIYLPDAAALKKSILDFAWERLSAHVPAVATSESFRNLIRKDGAILLLDGFDRLSSEERLRFAAEIGTTVSDFPKVHVVATARPTGSAELPLVHCDLCDLTDDDQNAIAEKRGIPFPATSVMRRLCRNAYMLARTLDQLQMKPGSTTRLEAMMEESLERLLMPAGASLEDFRVRVEAIELLAVATTEHDIDISQLTEFLRSASIPPAVINDLVLLGAITRRGTKVEVSHEILGDFLRAKKHSLLLDEAIVGQIEQAPFLPGSMYARFLAALATTPQRQTRVMNALLLKDLRAYILALPFCAETAGKANGIWFLEELLDGFVLPTKKYWPGLQPLLEEETGAERETQTSLGVVGMLTPGESVAYGYTRVPPGSGQVRIGNPFGFSQVHINKLLSERPDYTGRKIGTSDLRDGLLNLVKYHRLPGGLTWRRERLRARLKQVLLEHNGKPFQLAKLQALFEPDRGSSIFNKEITVDDLLEDIEALCAVGEKTLAASEIPKMEVSPEGGSGHWTEFYTDPTLCEIVRQRHLRSLAMYREVAEASFGTSASLLAKYRVLPVRYESVIVRNSFRGITATEYPRWYPVAQWEDVEVNVTVSKKPPLPETEEDFITIQRMLGRLGRPAEGIRRSIWSSLAADYTDGQSEVLRQVVYWLKRDIELLFSSPL
jgi:hypothetical protein